MFAMCVQEDREGLAAGGRWGLSLATSGCESQGAVLEAALGLFHGREARKVLVDSGGAEDSPDAVGDTDEGDLAALVGLGDVEVDEDAEPGRVHVLEFGAVDDEEVSVNGLQFGLQGEDMTQGERSS